MAVRSHMIGACFGTFDLSEGGSFPFRGSAQINLRRYFESIDLGLYGVDNFEYERKLPELEVVIEPSFFPMPWESQPFFKAIAADPDDSITRLIFGDWLEEGGYSREASLWCHPLMKPGILTINAVSEGKAHKLVTTPVVNVPWEKLSWESLAERRMMRFTDSIDAILKSLPVPITPRGAHPVIGEMVKLIAPPWFAAFQARKQSAAIVLSSAMPVDGMIAST